MPSSWRTARTKCKKKWLNICYSIDKPWKHAGWKKTILYDKHWSISLPIYAVFGIRKSIKNRTEEVAQRTCLHEQDPGSMPKSAHRKIFNLKLEMERQPNNLHALHAREPRRQASHRARGTSRRAQTPCWPTGPGHQQEAQTPCWPTGRGTSRKHVGNAGETTQNTRLPLCACREQYPDESWGAPDNQVWTKEEEKDKEKLAKSLWE